MVLVINVIVFVEDVVKWVRNDEFWVEFIFGMQLFEVWVFGNDYQNIIDYVNVWKVKYVVDQVFNEICQKKKVVLVKIVDE